MSWVGKRRCALYIYEDIPRAVQDMMRDTGVVRCNFDMGGEVDAEAVIEENHSKNMEQWL